MNMLKVTNLKVSYGGIEALKGISFNVEQGQIVSLIGANGAGKSTTLNTVAGLLKPRTAPSPSMARTSSARPPARWSPSAWRSAPKAAASSSR